MAPLQLSRNASRYAAAAAASAAVPLLVARGAFDREWRKTLPDRLGAGRWPAAAISLNPPDRPIWIHGASVGEVGGLLPVVRAIGGEFERTPLLGTTTSATGRFELEKSGLFNASCILPFDHPLLLRRALTGVDPALFLCTETELWPSLFFFLKQHGIPAILINARISDYSYPRYRMIRPLIAPVLGCLQQILAQTDLDAERLAALGASPERISVSGSTKYDHDVPERDSQQVQRLGRELGIVAGQLCFVAGSVRPGEEELIGKAYLEARLQVPGLQMIIAPRHPERFPASARVLQSLGIDFVKRSQETPARPGQAVLLDTLGELRAAYGLADVAFVGGTMVDIGGHNPLEPAAYRIPVLVGPHTANVRDAIQALARCGAHLEVNTATALADRLIRLGNDKELRDKMGELAYRVWKSNRGATAKVIETIGEYLPSRRVLPSTVARI